MADLLERRYQPVRNPADNSFVQHIADKLLAALPPTGIPFRVQILESGDINAFSLAGGRIYLSRKLVAVTESEDELAAVITHEMGHIVSHQIALETSADLRRLLGVTSVGDRAGHGGPVRAQPRPEGLRGRAGGHRRRSLSCRVQSPCDGLLERLSRHGKR